MTIKNGIFTALWCLTVVAGLFLGTWQLYRLEWKQKWLARIDHAYTQPVAEQDITRIEGLCSATYAPNETLQNVIRTFFIRWQGTVTFAADQYFIIKPRVKDGMFGGYLFQHVELKPWLKLWINRGFVPNTPTVQPVSGRQHVTLQIRATDIDPQAVLKQNPQISLDALQASPGCGALALIGVIEQTDVKSPWPLAVGDRPNPPNDHLAYAIFWFTMSGVAFIFGAYAAWRACKRRIV